MQTTLQGDAATLLQASHKLPKQKNRAPKDAVLFPRRSDVSERDETAPAKERRLLTEERQDVLGIGVGDGKGLDRQLLLGLQRL